MAFRHCSALPISSAIANVRITAQFVGRSLSGFLINGKLEKPTRQDLSKLKKLLSRFFQP
ncbi:hypothetical protein ACF3DV_28595 [Chlorogloeopsis fritschii PCC 9212]|uniref:hypothetical protein n=1 Tax=Chlorogloeopsis fritschii TaxID=1124 RepID=UPI0003095840